MKSIPKRNWFMDFHTSKHIPGIGSKFDPEEFARALKESGADGCVAFARCHHGWSYYPTKVGETHPHLEYPDMVGGMIDAARSVGVSPGLYMTVGWDERIARTHPEWRQCRSDGQHFGPPPDRPGWTFMCFNSPYADYIEAQLREVLELYDFDRITFDIVSYRLPGCYCQWCCDGMRHEGLDPEKSLDHQYYTLTVRERFMERMSKVVASKKPDIPLYYNNIWNITGNRKTYAGRFLKHQPSMMNIESLPSGFWGYDHFPLQAAYYGQMGRDISSTTGRFHLMWGDFGGLKNPAALEYECLRHVFYGFKTSVGDQLHPSGKVESQTVKLLSDAFETLKKHQDLLLETKPVYEVGILAGTGSNPDMPFDTDSVPETGAMRMLLESQIPFRIFDGFEDEWPVRVMILPDHVYLDEERRNNVEQFIAGGGKIIASGASGLGMEDWPVEGKDEFAYKPSYLHRTDNDFLWDYHFVLYERSWQVRSRPDTKVLAVLAEPYFNRTAEHFCSHRHTPVKSDTDSPAVCINDNVAYIANDIFRGYRMSGYSVYKKIVLDLLARLMPDPLIRTNCPSTAELTMRRNGNDLLVCLLHYCPQRRGYGNGTEIIEEAQHLVNVKIDLKVKRQPDKVTLEPDGRELSCNHADGRAIITLPVIKGAAVVVLKDVLI